MELVRVLHKLKLYAVCKKQKGKLLPLASKLREYIKSKMYFWEFIPTWLYIQKSKVSISTTTCMGCFKFNKHNGELWRNLYALITFGILFSKKKKKKIFEFIIIIIIIF